MRPWFTTVVPSRTPRARARNTATMDTRWYRNEISQVVSRKHELPHRLVHEPHVRAGAAARRR